MVAAWGGTAALATVTLSIGTTAIPFASGTDIVVGTDIAKNGANTTFTLASTGTYAVFYRIDTTVAVVGGSVQVYKNSSVAQGASISIVTTGSRSDHLLVSATAGDTIQLVATSAVNVGLGGTASVLIERVA